MKYPRCGQVGTIALPVLRCGAAARTTYPIDLYTLYSSILEARRGRRQGDTLSVVCRRLFSKLSTALAFGRAPTRNAPTITGQAKPLLAVKEMDVFGW